MIEQQRTIQGQAAEIGRLKAGERPATIITFTPQAALQPYTTTAGVVFIAGLPRDTVAPRRWRLTVRIATTNNAGNFWTIALRTLAGAALATVGTGARAPGTWYTIDVDLSSLAALTVAADAGLDITIARTGAPGTLQLHPLLLVL